MKNYFDLKGQVAIVTGASTGLGVQMAKALANNGANIVVVARRQNLIEEVAKQIADEFGVETLPVRCDITDTEGVNNMVKTDVSTTINYSIVSVKMKFYTKVIVRNS